MRDLLGYRYARRLQDRFPALPPCPFLPAEPSPIGWSSVAREPGIDTGCKIVIRAAPDGFPRASLLNQAVRPFDLWSPGRWSEGRHPTNAGNGVFRPRIPFDSSVTTGHSRTLSPRKNHVFRNLRALAKRRISCGFP